MNLGTLCETRDGKEKGNLGIFIEKTMEKWERGNVFLNIFRFDDDESMFDGISVLAGVTRAVGIAGGLVNLCDFDESATFVSSAILPNRVRMVKEFD